MKHLKNKLFVYLVKTVAFTWIWDIINTHKYINYCHEYVKTH